MPEPLSPEEVRRYARHIVLKGIGGEGQARLKAGRVLVVGAGGLGSPAIAYLAAAGVGTIGIVDDDTVALSNLQRQVLHTTEAVGRRKTDSAAAFVGALNPHVRVELHNLRLDGDNAAQILRPYGVVLDGSDNLLTRHAVAAAAERLQVPLVSGAVSMLDGQLTVFAAGGARFRDLYGDGSDDSLLPSCEANGVLGPVTGVIGTLMAMEAIKLLSGFGQPLTGRLLHYDSAAASFSEFNFAS